jgi:endonuclease/exonuclease/phosphatase family metal-dependent hydrolase
MASSDLGVTCVTWNIAQARCEAAGSRIARLFETATSDIITISVQEITETSLLVDGLAPGPSAELTTSLTATFPANYTLAASANQGSVVLFVFFLKNSRFQLTVNDTFRISHYAPPVTHSKASLVALLTATLGGVSRTISIIGNHLECYDEQYATRVTEWKRLVAEAPRTDYTVMFGDLNFRIELPRDTVADLIARREIAAMITADQLERAKRENPEFAGFREAPIGFLPTYKFDADSDEYDTSAKRRIPSYVDRVLVAEGDGVPPIDIAEYTTVNDKLSDHRPVVAKLRIPFD